MRPLRIAIVAGEESGDQLGAELLAALRAQYDGELEIAGVGGALMRNEGLNSLFPLSDIAVMGFSAVLAQLPKIIRLAYRLIDHIVAFKPDILVIIDSPDFTHPVARRVRRKLPKLPVIDYVSPSVWAWRSGRARKMTRYIDHVLGILPFEPDAYKRLAGPACTYVGHPLVDKIAAIKAQIIQAAPQKTACAKRLLVMPGSRTSEVTRLLGPFGEAVSALKDTLPDLQVEIPAVAHLKQHIQQETSNWVIQPQIVSGEEAKFEAFAKADAALVASGTATLELALWGIPMAVGYKLDPIAKRLKWLGNVSSIVLPNLILEENIVPEFIDEDCSGLAMSDAILPLLQQNQDYTAQIEAFKKLQNLCSVAPHSPADRAAQLVLEYAPPQSNGV
ncbi:lipid-A-disaccharide synthase [Pararhizobium sp. IMCC21322]|uniref:lipid-A-disaccharide synthase n=1 Tax=Pararhizobium sp. IMCC21322 TaxID=3067903 RepID=UPI0027411145|nr:lipid-A-disaccharide synthase [Pararhizobium sp. IMCC21322]